LKWENTNEDELIQYLVEEKGFSEDRIRSGIKSLQKLVRVPPKDDSIPFSKFFLLRVLQVRERARIRKDQKPRKPNPQQVESSRNPNKATCVVQLSVRAVTNTSR
ncbi:Elongation of fatty acids protein 2, partial [Desmophyllum pertusum]